MRLRIGAVGIGPARLGLKVSRAIVGGTHVLDPIGQHHQARRTPLESKARNHRGRERRRTVEPSVEDHLHLLPEAGARDERTLEAVG